MVKSSKPNGFRSFAKPPSPRSSRILTPCPTCEAAPGVSCFSLRSWVWTYPFALKCLKAAGEGFFTERMDGFHRARKAPAAPRTPATPPGDRAALRRRLSQLAGAKLGGTERLRTRKWAGQVGRTAEELRAKIEQLEGMGDIR